MEIRRIPCQVVWDYPEWPQIMGQYVNDVKHVEFTPEPDYDHYRAIEKAGFLVCIGAFNDGDLVGFCTYMKCPHPLRKGYMCAKTETFWVKPELRNHGIGKNLAEAVSQFAKDDGCDGIYWCVRTNTPAAAMMQKILGDPVELSFFKNLRD